MVRLFARRDDHREGDHAASAKEVAAFARAYPGHNVYVAPNPTAKTGGVRHSAQDVTHWSYFLIDVDPVCECEDPTVKCTTCMGLARPEAALAVALDHLGRWTGHNFAWHSPIIVDSGRGVQAWIRVDDHPLYTAKARQKPSTGTWPLLDRGQVRRVNGYWLKRLDEVLGVTNGCRIDTSVSDLPRVMRCPGTVNVKTGRTAHFLFASDHVFKNLGPLLVMNTPKQALVDPEPPAAVAAGQTWQSVFPHLTRLAQEYLTRGQAEPGRHKAMWHTAKKLRELGVTRREARRAITWANGLQGEKEELPAEQIKHALDTAYNS